MQAMKPDPGSHVTMTFSKATRLFSCWSNSGKSFSPSCDSRAFSSATARKSLACEASVCVCVCVCVCVRARVRACVRVRGGKETHTQLLLSTGLRTINKYLVFD